MPATMGARPFQFLADGGMAEILLATRQSDGQRVALKRIKRPHHADPEFVAMFLDEARLDAIGVFGYSEEDGTEAATFADVIDPDEVAARVDRVAGLAAGAPRSWPWAPARAPSHSISFSSAARFTPETALNRRWPMLRSAATASRLSATSRSTRQLCGSM